MKEQKKAVFKQIFNYHPEFPGQTVEQLQTESLTLENCRDAIGFEYGFGGWADVEEQGGGAYDVDFERAVDDLLGNR